MKRYWIAFVAAGLLAIAAIAPVAGQEDSTTVDLEEINGSGVSGTATLTGENGQTMVEIDLEGTPEDGDHPVHIHQGTCDDLGDVVYPLENVVDGTSESTVEASLDDIMAEDHAINVHLSEDQMDVFVACGDIAMADEEDDAVTDDDDAAVDEEDDAVAEDDDEAMVDEEDDAVAEDDDEAMVDEEDDAVAEDDDEAMVDEEDDAVADDEDPAVGGPGETDDAEDIVPATGGVAGLGSEIGVVLMTLVAGATLGAGLFLRRRALQF